MTSPTPRRRCGQSHCVSSWSRGPRRSQSLWRSCSMSSAMSSKRFSVGALLHTTSPVTLEAVGTDLAVTRERVRQIQVRAEERIEALLATSRFAPVHWAAFTLHTALGSLAPVEIAERELSRLVGEIAADNVIVASTILLQPRRAVSDRTHGLRHRGRARDAHAPPACCRRPSRDHRRRGRPQRTRPVRRPSGLLRQRSCVARSFRRFGELSSLGRTAEWTSLSRCSPFGVNLRTRRHWYESAVRTTASGRFTTASARSPAWSE